MLRCSDVEAPRGVHELVKRDVAQLELDGRGPRRDLVGQLAAAVNAAGKMHFGLYNSLFEWFNPMYLQEKANNYRTQDFVAGKTGPELYEIITRHQHDGIWSDGDWEAPDSY